MALGSILASIAVPLATGFLSNILNGGKTSSSQQQAIQQVPQIDWVSLQKALQNVPTISMDQAVQQAQDVINPLYDRQLEQTLKNIDYQNMQRGFYGQLPGDVLKTTRAAETERNRIGQIANLAQQLYQQSQSNALAQQQMLLNTMLSGQQLGLSEQQLNMQQRQQNTSNLQNWLNLGLQGLFNYYNLTGQFPWQGNLLQQITSGQTNVNKLTNNQLFDLLKGLNLNAESGLNNLSKTNMVGNIQAPTAYRIY